MKILFTVFSPSSGMFGSLTRMMALAKVAKEKGHSVEFAASGLVARMLEQKNFKVNLLPQSTLFGLPPFLSKKLEKRSQRIQIPVKEGRAIGSIWFVYLLSGLLSAKYLKSLVQKQLNLIELFKPDLIITEMDFGVYLSSFISESPLVTTYALVSLKGEKTFPWRKALRLTNRILRSYGKNKVDKPSDLFVNKRTLRLIPNIPQLDGSCTSERNIIFTGNLLEPIRKDDSSFNFDREKRCVFVYLGTGSLSLDSVESVLVETFSRYPHLICYVGAQSILSDYSRNNVRFLSYVPSDIIMPFCDLVICHGGLNTITQSLEAGIPLLLFPGPIFERRYNASMVEKNGAGKMGEISDFNSKWILENYENRRKFHQGVSFLQREFQKKKNLNSAFKEVETWFIGQKEQ